ncbi:MAG: T9SS type A sorting domain-containing protein [Bacteroidetes bacterium]|nr:MAG: T9SS type A sorting domain-containing protein [Bacteroidota bacterium]
MKNFILILTLCIGPWMVQAQGLCVPFFINGCSSWHADFLAVGDIDWTFDGSDCSQSDFTFMEGNLTAGTDIQMEVQNGNWCGVSVWVDFNRDDQYDDSENLYHTGNGGQETVLHQFSIQIPPTTLNGTYILRVITSWGSDGFTPGENGSGGCGTYQYGSYNDFTIHVSGGIASLEELENQKMFQLLPKGDLLIVDRLDSNPVSYQIYNMQGQMLDQSTLEKQPIELTNYPKGIYVMHLEGYGNKRFVRL